MIFSLSLLAAALITSAPADSLQKHEPVTAPAQFFRESKLSDSVLDQNALPHTHWGKSNLSDSNIKSENTVTVDTGKFVSPKEFSWAGIERYILDGSRPLRVSEIKPVTILSVEGTYLAVLIALHIYQENTFWRQSTSFRVRDNFDESFSANYGGHGIA